MTTNGGKGYFHIDENDSSEQIYALLRRVITRMTYTI